MRLAPTLLKFPTAIEMIACGSWHSMCASKTEVFAFGANGEGQLGVGDCVRRDMTKVNFFDSRAVRAIVCGGYFTFWICEDGVFSSGCNLSGQLGHGEESIRTSPVRVPFFDEKDQNPPISMCCGLYHCLALTKCGLYTWGDDQGVGRRYTPVPTRIPFFAREEILSISCSGYASLCLTQKGVYLWGTIVVHDVTTPELIHQTSNVIHISPRPTKASKTVPLLFILAREFCEDSLVHCDYLPLDMFRIVMGEYLF